MDLEMVHMLSPHFYPMLKPLQEVINYIFHAVPGHVPHLHLIHLVIGAEWALAAAQQRAPNLDAISWEAIDAAAHKVSVDNPTWNGQFSVQNLQTLRKYISPESMWWIQHPQAAPADIGALPSMFFPSILHRCTFNTYYQHQTSPVVLPCAELLGRQLLSMALVPPTRPPPHPPPRPPPHPLPHPPPHLPPHHQPLPVTMPSMMTVTLAWMRTREMTKHRASRASPPSVRSSNRQIPRGGRHLSSGSAWWRTETMN